jgi:hypothetical protein
MLYEYLHIQCYPHGIVKHGMHLSDSDVQICINS